MTVREDLIAARALIDTPRKWGRGAMYLNRKYCVLGACDAVAPHLTPRTTNMLKALGRANNSGLLLLQFNDDPSIKHADIMALFDRAINAA